jgi:microcystin-dependent protein
MAEPFIGEIRAFAFGLIPRGWAQCNGQLLSIQQNQPLFAILGTTYGGNGNTTFGLPNLQGRVPLHSGNGSMVLGQVGGEAQHTLQQQELPSHWHQLVVSGVTTGGDQTPFQNTIGAAQAYINPPPVPDQTMASQACSVAGNSAPHNNLMPYLTVNICIALQGIFPSRS